MAVLTRSSLHAWWADLRHHGMVLAPALLEEYFPDGPIAPGAYEYQRLRERYTVFETWYQQGRAYEQGIDHRPLYTWLDGVLDIFLGYPTSRWQKGSNVDPRWRHETFARERLAPNRILFQENNPNDPALFVWIEQTPHLAQGQGRTAYGKLLELLRAKNVRLGLLTNGRQFRLCYAGLDYDSWVEWDVENWFAEEEFRRQLYGFYTLLGPQGINARGEIRFPLREAADASRTRQSDLSFVLGEQVRESVELLLNEMNQAVYSNPALLAMVRRSAQDDELSERRLLEALYQSAVRIIMRLVIILFAEARDLLPRSLASYNTSYGLEGLFEQLSRARQHEGEKAMDEQYSAWVRLLSLCSLIYYGSPLPTLPVHAYGGMLFRPGEESSPDATLRAIALFESSDLHISDITVLKLLRLLKIGKVKVRQGRGSRWVNGPVDFSELRTEYIGLMYQGLLDFNLHRASQPMLFLNLGQEPVLPLNRLEAMTATELKDLLKKLSIEKSSSPITTEEDESEAIDNEQEQPEEQEELDDEPVADGAELDDLSEDEMSDEEDKEDEEGEEGVGDVTTETEAERLHRRALEWAERAVDVGGLLAKPRGRRTGDNYLYEQERTKRAKKLLRRVLDTHEFYLIRRGGTRKGSGTFYTKPQLAVPIARHTLESLLYTKRDDAEYEGDARDDITSTLIPRTPEEILKLKVCDPACGSASFLVAALHYMTDALYQALLYHKGIAGDASQTRLTFYGPPVTLPFGTPSRARPEEELLPVPPDAIDREPRIKARLRRYVVERCLYGVDLSPLAVELARMSLWIETMDKDLPFTFLDHKIKVGNALVGAWFDTFREYPIMAWMRDGGDDSHTNGVHYSKGDWTRSIKETRNDTIKPQLITQIESSLPQLFPEYLQETPEGVHNVITQQMEQLHTMPIESASEREERYRAMQQSPAYQELKQAFDRWCAAWFWPADELIDAPMPGSFDHPTDRTRTIVNELTEELHFFHWEIEFPDVFARPEHGFDAILANPPWELIKSQSLEFFTDYDPLYRTYGRQEALEKQKQLFKLDKDLERDWLLYLAFFKNMSNWVKRAASPFGDPTLSNMDKLSLKAGRKGEQIHQIWRHRRVKYSNYTSEQDNPFRYQGTSFLNTYKMFLEVSHHLLRRDGRMGMLVPSNIYTDQGSASLRKLFLDHCNWEWLFGFINRHHIFAIDSRFKFAVLLIEKGKQTEQLCVAFNQESLDQLLQANQVMQPFARQLVDRFSPYSLTIIEAQSPHDITILEKLYANNVLLESQEEQSWNMHYTTEFNMTTDSKLFPPVPVWESKGYHPDDYGRWINSEGHVALPLYEGRMIGAFDPSEKGWISGKGRSADWGERISFANKGVKPQYLISYKDYRNEEKALRGNKIGYMSIGSATNTRSMYTTLISDMPCGNAVPVLQPEKAHTLDILSLVATLNSYTYDYALRSRLGGININLFVIEETPLIPPSRIRPTICSQLAGRLNLIMLCFAPQWLEMRGAYPQLGKQHWRKLWAITEHERLRLRCILDAIVAELYGLDYDDFAWILRDAHDDEINRKTNIKGFWRVDDKKPETLRHTTLALVAFAYLKEVGFEAFCAEDWQFPEEVAAQLGPRFTEWQEQGTVEESWAECEYHARRMSEIVIPLPVPEQPEQDGAERMPRNKQKGNGKHNGHENKTLLQQVDLWSEE